MTDRAQLIGRTLFMLIMDSGRYCHQNNSSEIFAAELEN
jgi:hypothetical protein